LLGFLGAKEMEGKGVETGGRDEGVAVEIGSGITSREMN